MNQFTKAKRSQAKLRLAIDGPSGGGKTYSSLLIAKGLGCKKICMIDTERGSGSLYANILDYDVAQIEPPFSPKKYVELIQNAEEAGYDVIIIDSLSHAWVGEGGVLDMAEDAKKAVRNSFTAWRDVTPQHNKLVDALLNSKCHIIVTMRTKTAYEIQDKDGKKVPVKVGLAPVQRDGVEYEFTIVFDMSVEGHVASVSKDRTSLFDGQHFVPSEKTGQQIIQWLNSGEQQKPTADSPPINIEEKRAEKQKAAQKKADVETKNGNGNWQKTLWDTMKHVPDARNIWTSYAKDVGLTESTANATEEQKARIAGMVRDLVIAYDTRGDEHAFNE